MYGKIFEDIFDSTLSTQGDFVTTYIFMSMIVLADEHGFVRLSQDALYERLRFSNEFVVGEAFRSALSILESPDENSNLPYEQGRRIIPLTDIDEIEENRGWWIVNYLHYRDKANVDERKAARRDWMKNYQRNRRKNIKEKSDLESCKHPVNSGKQISAYTDTDTDTDKVKTNGHLKDGFDQFWDQYPKKRKKKPALEIWKRKKLHMIAVDIVQDVINRQTMDERWVKGFIPDPTTYLNQERWQDELIDSSGRKLNYTEQLAQEMKK